MDSQKAKTITAIPLEHQRRPHSTPVLQARPSIWGRNSGGSNQTPKSKAIVAVPALRMRSKSDLATPHSPNPYAVSSRIYRPSRSLIFDYNLSPVEQQHFSKCSDPMKSVPAAELELLRSGQRSTYLERRYEHSPDDKYNYPEATSWRYGWFHLQSNPCQKRQPRRD
ncbi:GL20173 [Drosophila persimilis]|uniref:GL20173 n=1 Tax=Drosophila persimilis TaxID=7234 RepID=B4H663_DROPE|nr:uncharacterized protein LOC6601304 [Drosophila persimilis]EDW33287.1 GL20173 [Drosophila persimilis]